MSPVLAVVLDSLLFLKAQVRSYLTKKLPIPLARIDGDPWAEDAGDNADHTAWSSSWRSFEAQQRLWQPDRSCTGCCDFRGASAHFVQIGLGTNTTFIQNLAGPWEEWTKAVDWLSAAMSETRASQVRGVAVEPVGELVKALQPATQQLPSVCLVQAAIGEFDRAGVDVLGLSLVSCEELVRQLAPSRRQGFNWELQYLQNMSTVDKAHPLMADCCAQLAEKYGVMPRLVTHHVDIWSYGKLAWDLNFVGCEVLMIDAEGHDAQILRSVIQHCRRNPRAWPGLSQFETQGHCDTLEGHGTEWRVIHSLQEEGYLLVGYSYHDSLLAHREALRQDPRLRRWVMEYQRFPYLGAESGVFCRRCLTSRHTLGRSIEKHTRDAGLR